MSLIDALQNKNPSRPQLPLIHCTKSELFFQIAEMESLNATDCKYFKEKLNYLFYGRPAYRPYQDSQNTSLGAFRPVAIILNPDLKIPIRRVFPFDTGAFFEGRYREFIPKHSKIENYQVEPNLDYAARLVSLFFESNRNYYFSRSHPIRDVAPTNLAAHSLSGMFQSSGLSDVDDRRSSIEFQVAETISLNKNSVMAVCMPAVYCEDDKLYNLIANEWAADIVEYDIYYDSPLHDLREVAARIKDYFHAKGFL